MGAEGAEAKKKNWRFQKKVRLHFCNFFEKGLFTLSALFLLHRLALVVRNIAFWQSCIDAANGKQFAALLPKFCRVFGAFFKP